MKYIFWFYIIAALLFLFLGCNGSYVPTPSTLDSLTEFVEALDLAATAATPLTPYAVPVKIGLVGLAAMLEALRRKEKAGRKHAEHVLNNGNNVT